MAKANNKLCFKPLTSGVVGYEATEYQNTQPGRLSNLFNLLHGPGYWAVSFLLQEPR